MATNSIEARKINSEKAKQRWQNPYYRKIYSNCQKPHSFETKFKLMLNAKKEENIKKSILNFQRYNESIKPLFQNKEYKEIFIRKMMKGWKNRPTELEKNMIDIIRRNNLSYKYVGNGGFILGGKNPDFINVNGEKIAIDVRNIWVCKKINKETPEEYTEKRIKHFANYGWKCLVFLSEDNKLNEEEVLNKIKELSMREI